MNHTSVPAAKTSVAPLCFLLALSLTLTSHAQWEIQNSHTTASLRGIDNAGSGVVWASGTDGTVLRTLDAGRLWLTCTTPPGAEKLDFRGIQAFDKDTAIVMSSGPGDQSRLYKTTDGCKTWKLVFTNPDEDGFWDAIQFTDRLHGFLLGDPVHIAGSEKKRLVFKQTRDGGRTWISWDQRIEELSFGKDVSVFAASNSSLIAQDRFNAVLATGGKDGSMLIFPSNSGIIPCSCSEQVTSEQKLDMWWAKEAPFPQTETGGIFSIAENEHWIMAVGGDFRQAESSVQTAVRKDRGFGAWQPAQTTPHGYRSAVAFDERQKLWITVGPNGTDISADDGRNWRALKPSPGEPADADKNWNALSLPFVVGPHGRIGRLAVGPPARGLQPSASPRPDERPD